METKQIVTTATLKAAGDEEGQIEAVISSFDVVDRGGDIVLASAFTDGQECLMVWSHDWGRPIGKGVVRVEETRAVFAGQIWLDTDDGLQAYRKIKNAGDLQQYSWGFRVLDADFAERDGQYVRVISGAEMFEASPVLVGEGLNTETLALKNADKLPLPDHFARVLDTVNGDAQAVRTLKGRFEERADVREKAGRELSKANQERLIAIRDAQRGLAADLDALVEAATTPKDDGKEARALRGAALRQLAAITLIAS